MSEYMKNYRLTHPEYREYERKRDVIYAKTKYDNDPEYKEKKKAAALARYYRLKEAKGNNTILATS
jgi:hypothetical protein